MRKLFLAATATAIVAVAPGVFGQTNHSNHSGHAENADGIHTQGTLHKIDGDLVNLTHDAIPEIGWPTMTMDLKLLENAELGDVQPGDAVSVVLEKDAEGMYGVRALSPGQE